MILNAVTFKMTDPECRALVAALNAIKVGDDDSPKETRGIIRRVCLRAYKAGYQPPQDAHVVQELLHEAA